MTNPDSTRSASLLHGMSSTPLPSIRMKMRYGFWIEDADADDEDDVLWMVIVSGELNRIQSLLYIFSSHQPPH